MLVIYPFLPKFKYLPARHGQSPPVLGLLSTSRLICVFEKLCLRQRHIQTRNLPQLVGKFLLLSTRFLRHSHLLENRRAGWTSSYFLCFYTRGLALRAECLWFCDIPLLLFNDWMCGRWFVWVFGFWVWKLCVCVLMYSFFAWCQS